MRIKLLILSALFAGMTAIGSYIVIPAPLAPFSLQLFFTLGSGAMLGMKYGALSQAVFVIMGLAGLPVFSGGGGGPGYALMPSFGFIIGFIAASFVTGAACRGKTGFFRVFAACLAGTAAMYIIALPYMYFILNAYLGKEAGPLYVLKYGMLLFLPGDISKCAAVAALRVRLGRLFFR